MASGKRQTVRQRLLSNIRQNIRRMEKRGYEFPTGYYENIKTLSEENISAITPEELYESSVHFVADTGEYVQGSEYRGYERSWAALKGQATKARKAQESQTVAEEQDTYYPNEEDLTFENVDELMRVLGRAPEEQGATVYGEITRRPPKALEKEESTKNMLQNLLQQKYNEDPQSLSERLADNYDALESAVEHLTYNSDEAVVESAGDIIADIINGGRMSISERAQYAEFSDENSTW